MPPHVFAVDGERVRYGCFAPGNGSIEMKSWDSVALPANGFLEGPMGGPAKEASLLREAVAALVERAPEPPTEASLVLPDDWLRVTFAEMEELPRSGKEQDEVVRWKLQRLVPFRVEDLRVSARELSPAPGGEGKRMLLGFAVDALLAQLEETFEACHVRLGQITNETASLLAATRSILRDVELGIVAVASESGYGLVFTHRSEPILHRRKSLALAATATPAEIGNLVLRDLKLTRAFVADQIGEARTGRILLVGPQELHETWNEWLREAFELPVFRLDREHLPVQPWPQDAAVHDLAPMFGASQQVVD